MVFLTHGEEGEQAVSTMRIGIEEGAESGNIRYALCVPPHLVPDNIADVPVYYFYDNQGNPYRDSLLTQRVVCPPVRTDYNIQEAF